MMTLRSVMNNPNKLREAANPLIDASCSQEAYNDILCDSPNSNSITESNFPFQNMVLDLAINAAIYHDLKFKVALQAITDFIDGDFEAGNIIEIDKFYNLPTQNRSAINIFEKEWEKLTNREKQLLQLRAVYRSFENIGVHRIIANEWKELMEKRKEEKV